MSANKVTVGVDIGGTNTAFGLVTESGKILFERIIPTDGHQGSKRFFVDLCTLFKKEIKPFQDKYELAAVGVGAPNANYYSGKIENPPNLPWDVVNVVKEIQNCIDIPVFVTNDANATAIGEMYFGAARGMKNFIAITLGTGLGSGIVVDGDLVYGEDGFAGELGHTCVDANGRTCGCGNQGCLEAYVSAPGLCRTAFQLMARRTEDSPLREISFNNLTAKEVADLASSGDTIAKEAFEYTGRLLGVSLANAVAFSRPEAIILFGGLAGSGSLIFDPTKKWFEKHLMNAYRGKIKLLKSDLQNVNSAILGAAALAWNELKKIS